MDALQKSARATGLCQVIGQNAMARAYRAGLGEHATSAARQQAMVGAAVGAVRIGFQVMCGAGSGWDAQAVQDAAMEQAVIMAVNPMGEPYSGLPADSESMVLAAFAAIVQEARSAV